MDIHIDVQKAETAAKLLNEAYSFKGIFGHSKMPEDIIPDNVVKGSIEHIIFVTLTVSIDYQRDGMSLWKNSKITYEDEGTTYLFDSKKLSETSYEKIMSDMKKHDLSKKHTNDIKTWRTIGTTFYKKWDGNPLNFIKSCNYDCPTILSELKKSTHLDNEKQVPDFPFLSGNKIGSYWIKILRDNAGISELKNVDKVPIPVDIHVARATLSLGLLKGKYEGRLENLLPHIRQAWFEGVKDINENGIKMIALDMDEALWHLSKYGCTYRDKKTGKCPKFEECEVKELCTAGKVSIQKGRVEIDI